MEPGKRQWETNKTVNVNWASGQWLVRGKGRKGGGGDDNNLVVENDLLEECQFLEHL